MPIRRLICDSYFDGRQRFADGPYTVELRDGRIDTIQRGLPANGEDAAAECKRVPFIMPGLVEAHAHLFLDGGELDFEVRKNYLSAPRERMLTVARESLARNLDAGVTLIRDAGDIHGINTQIRAEAAQATVPTPVVRSAGRAIRKAKRYGSFMAAEATDHASIVATVHDLAAEADVLKILLTGIIDFETGKMKGDVQFDLDEARLIVRTAAELGLRTFCHCSGPEGLAIATEAGIHSIEHGFFMEERFLHVMAEKRLAWVPTFSPVYFQYDRPELAGWNAATVEELKKILDRHFLMLARAAQLGVPIVAGSDAGSYGVPHGTSLIDELFFHRQAGLSLEQTLASATSVPRELWGCEDATLAPGRRVDLIALAGDPWEDMEALRKVVGMVVGSHDSFKRTSARVLAG